jgi:O-succinylbenzoic acid--CoA ligase
LSIFAAARTAPDCIGLVTANESFTFDQLAGLSVSRARALAACARPVLLQPKLDLDSLLWIYASAATGTPFVVLSPNATLPERSALQAATGAGDLPRLETTASAAFAEPSIDPQRPLALIPTSGSTAAPKVVVLSRRAVLASAAASAANLGIDRGEIWLLCLSLAHVAGLAVILRMLAARRRVVLFDPAPAGLLARVPDLAVCLSSQRVTLVSLVPLLLERLLDAGFTPPASLRAVLLGGAGCSTTLAQRAWRAGIPLVTSYGLTETGSQIVARRYAERRLPLPESSGVVSSGHPLEGVEIQLRGEHIAIRSAALLSAYAGGPPALDADGWFCTQDRGKFGPDGELYVLGRSDLTLVSGGENVDPEEVERTLCALPEIQEACVFGLPSPEFGQRLAVAVVAAPGCSRAIDLPWITCRLRATLARSKHPRTLFLADALPRTSTGKLDRRACTERFARES